MDVRIGITQSMRELELELGDDVDRAELVAKVTAALDSDTGVLWLTDRKGREVAVPAAKISYVEVGSGTESRNIGFSV
ncbi:MAG: DUF3107 domain-containing protein [Acidimicrobiales bacterium]